MNSNTSTYENEEVYKRLHELMEVSQTVKDDSYFDSDEKLFGKPCTNITLKDISKITLKLSANAKCAYTDGPITISFLTKKGATVKDKRFTCFIYSEDYYPMCNSESSGKYTRRGANHFNIEILCQNIWLPGHYFLLVRDTSEDVLSRIAFHLDEILNISMGEPETCALSGIDDILTACVENYESNWDVIATTPGAAQLKQYALRCRQLKIYNEFRKALKGKELKSDSNLLIYTRDKDWNAEIFRMLQELSVWGCYFTHIDCSTLYNSTLQNPYSELNEILNLKTNQVFCLTNIKALLNTGGKLIVKYIVEKIHEGSAKYWLWLVGSHQEVDSVMDVYTSLRELFLRDNHVEQQPYTGFEIVQAFFTIMKNEHLGTTDEVKDCLSRALLKLHQEGCFTSDSLKTIRRFVAEDVRPHYLEHALRDIAKVDGELPNLTLDDIDINLLPHSTTAFDDSIQELMNMVGLDDIKESIVTMANQSRFFMERRKEGFQTTNNMAHHAIFTGNPGTGKTTVARMLGKIYRSIGLLSKGEVICTDRTSLVGRYIGETEENMKTILEEARGNVLFIDEAYNLYDGANDRKDYGAKVIDCLLTILSQPNPDMVIIFAGYEKEMDAMLTTNPGLTGRFPYKYRFSDYTAEQLMKIACQLFSRDEYILNDDAQTMLNKCICDTISRRNQHFSNARWMEQFIRNGIIPAMANRIMASGTKDYQHILPEDVENGYKKFNPRMIELKPRQQVGFQV